MITYLRSLESLPRRECDLPAENNIMTSNSWANLPLKKKQFISGFVQETFRYKVYKKRDFKKGQIKKWDSRKREDEKKSLIPAVFSCTSTMNLNAKE